MNNKQKTPTPGKMMGGGMNRIEKPKNFKDAIFKIFKYAKDFKILIYISIALAVFGSILSIISPNRLSDLTDELTKGLIPNVEKLTLIKTDIMSSLDEKQIATKMNQILQINLDVKSINNSKNISSTDKQVFNVVLKQMNTVDNKIPYILELPESIQNIVLPTTVINNITITTQDKIEFIKLYTTKTPYEAILNAPLSIQKVLLPDSIIDSKNITTEDKVQFIKATSNLTKNSNQKDMYAAFDKLPKSIYNMVKPSINMNNVKTMTLILLAIYGASALFTLVQGFIMARVSNKYSKKMRSEISTKINKLPLKYYDTHELGNTLSIVTNDVDTINQSLNTGFVPLIRAIALFVGAVAMMFYTNWILAITAILSTVIGFVFMIIILGKSQKYFVEIQAQLGKLNGHIEEIYTNHNIVKVYNGKNDSDKKFDQYNKAVFNASLKSQFLSGLMPSVMGFIGDFGYVAVCLVGALLVNEGTITYGVIVAFIMYVRLFTQPLRQMAQGMTQLQSAAAAGERVFTIFEEEEMKDESNITKSLEVNKVKGEIAFDHVKFGYDKDKIIINDFSAKVKKGQKIAIVGPTGAGKTTMVNLLMKFYDINEGNILIDGTKISDITRHNIHDLFVMVLQDTWLFNGTLRDNIKYNKEHVTDEQILNVCEQVGLDHFIETLPNGLDSIVGDSESISAGQKQLLTIARGMIKDAPFLILDEATSNVDTRTEILVQQAMDKLTVGKTSFIIAHRLSTIKNADLILVMDKGNIIEQGTHKELMKKNGFYADIYNSQFKL